MRDKFITKQNPDDGIPLWGIVLGAATLVGGFFLYNRNAQASKGSGSSDGDLDDDAPTPGDGGKPPWKGGDDVQVPPDGLGETPDDEEFDDGLDDEPEGEGPGGQGPEVPLPPGMTLIPGIIPPPKSPGIDIEEVELLPGILDDATKTPESLAKRMNDMFSGSWSGIVSAQGRELVEGLTKKAPGENRTVAQKRGVSTLPQAIDYVFKALFVKPAADDKGMPAETPGVQFEKQWWKDARTKIRSALVEASTKGLNYLVDSSFLNLSTQSPSIHRELFPLWLSMYAYAPGQTARNYARAFFVERFDQPARSFWSLSSNEFMNRDINKKMVTDAGLNFDRGRAQMPTIVPAISGPDAQQNWNQVQITFEDVWYSSDNRGKDQSGTRAVFKGPGVSTMLSVEGRSPEKIIARKRTQGKWKKDTSPGKTIRNNYIKTLDIAKALRAKSASWSSDTWAVWYVYAGAFNWRPQTPGRSVLYSAPTVRRQSSGF